MEVDITLRKC